MKTNVKLVFALGLAGLAFGQTVATPPIEVKNLVVDAYDARNPGQPAYTVQTFNDETITCFVLLPNQVVYPNANPSLQCLVRPVVKNVNREVAAEVTINSN